MSTTTTAYRQLYRQLISRAGPATHKDQFRQHLRAMFTAPRSDQSAVELRVAAQNAADFLKAQRSHSELLKRYNPVTGMSTEEHLEATAARVGLKLTEDKQH